MTAIPEIKEPVCHDLEDKAVCSDHGRRVCQVCCLDFNFGDNDSEYDSAVEGDQGDDRVFVLVDGLARFTPQLDGQVKGERNPSRFQKVGENPAKPATPDQLQLHYCGDCEVSWLVGHKGIDAARSHPSHHAYFHVCAGTGRSLIVFINGACQDSGPKAAKGSIGVYFGPGSSHNISRALDTTRPTNQKAEISAAIDAMRHVLEVIVPTRRETIRLASQANSAHSLQSANRFRLILATDSSYLVECFCKHMRSWTINQTARSFKTLEGKKVENSDRFVALWEEINLLARAGVQVVWYHVPSEFNKEAVALANDALHQ